MLRNNSRCENEFRPKSGHQQPSILGDQLVVLTRSRIQLLSIFDVSLIICSYLQSIIDINILFFTSRKWAPYSSESLYPAQISPHQLLDVIIADGVHFVSNMIVFMEVTTILYDHLNVLFSASSHIEIVYKYFI